jgi:type I restriction enzyme S subunit
MNITPLGTLTLEGGKFVAAQAGVQRVQRGDILFNNTNSPKWVGKTAWVSASDELAFSNHMTRLRVPGDRVDSKFLASYLHFQQATGYFEAICSNHVNQASVSRRRLLETEMPVPPLEEQRRIVAILEDHLSRLDAAESSLRRSVKRLERMTDAARDRALERARINAGRTVSIGEIARVSSGMTPLKGNRAFYDGGTIPWITSGDLWQGVVTEAKQFVTQKALDATSLKILPTGTLLVAMYGEGKTRGTAAELAIPATTNQACAGIVLSDPDLRAWVHLVLKANYGALRRLAAGGVQPNLNLSLIRSIQVPLPDRSVREMLLSEVTEVEAATKRLSNGLGMAKCRSAALRRSLLAAAFSGRLTGSSTAMSEAPEMVNA